MKTSSNLIYNFLNNTFKFINKYINPINLNKQKPSIYSQKILKKIILKLITEMFQEKNIKKK